MPAGAYNQPSETVSLVCGTATTSSSTAAAITTLGSAGTIPAKGLEMVLQARSTNTVDVVLGDSATQTIHIPPGAVMTISVADFSKIFIKSATNATAVNVDTLARV